MVFGGRGGGVKHGDKACREVDEGDDRDDADSCTVIDGVLGEQEYALVYVYRGCLVLEIESDAKLQGITKSVESMLVKYMARQIHGERTVKKKN